MTTGYKVAIPYSSGLRFSRKEKLPFVIVRTLSASQSLIHQVLDSHLSLMAIDKKNSLSSQSLIHQVLDSHGNKGNTDNCIAYFREEVAIPYSSGLRFSHFKGMTFDLQTNVAIPYSSGLRFSLHVKFRESVQCVTASFL